MRGRTAFVGLVVAGAVASAIGGRDYDAAQAAVFRELLSEAPHDGAGPARSVCLAVSSGHLSDWRGRRDPTASVLVSLGGEDARIYPASRCREDADGVWDPANRAAILLSSGRLEWVSADFVKTEGYWLLDGLSARGFRLTLSRVDGSWHIDMALPTWVS
jgi:hypothetical protein